MKSALLGYEVAAYRRTTALMSRRAPQLVKSHMAIYSLCAGWAIDGPRQATSHLAQRIQAMSGTGR